MTRISTAALLCALLASPGAWAEERVYRWVDEEGKVHYTPTLPPEAANRPHDILSASGTLMERVTDPSKPKQKETKKEDAAEQARLANIQREKQVTADRLLLLKYRSEQEILDAMALEIDHLKYDERLLTASRNSAMNSLAHEIRNAANLQRTGKTVPEDKQRTIRLLQKRVLADQSASDKLDARKTTIRAGFTDDLERYRQLRGDTGEAGSEG